MPDIQSLMQNPLFTAGAAMLGGSHWIGKPPDIGNLMMHGMQLGQQAHNQALQRELEKQRLDEMQRYHDATLGMAGARLGLSQQRLGLGYAKLQQQQQQRQMMAQALGLDPQMVAGMDAEMMPPQGAGAGFADDYGDDYPESPIPAPTPTPMPGARLGAARGVAPAPEQFADEQQLEQQPELGAVGGSPMPISPPPAAAPQPVQQPEAMAPEAPAPEPMQAQPQGMLGQAAPAPAPAGIGAPRQQRGLLADLSPRQQRAAQFAFLSGHPEQIPRIMTQPPLDAQEHKKFRDALETKDANKFDDLRDMADRARDLESLATETERLARETPDSMYALRYGALMPYIGFGDEFEKKLTTRISPNFGKMSRNASQMSQKIKTLLDMPASELKSLPEFQNLQSMGGSPIGVPKETQLYQLNYIKNMARLAQEDYKTAAQWVQQHGTLQGYYSSDAHKQLVEKFAPGAHAKRPSVGAVGTPPNHVNVPPFDLEEARRHYPGKSDEELRRAYQRGVAALVGGGG